MPLVITGPRGGIANRRDGGLRSGLQGLRRERGPIGRPSRLSLAARGQSVQLTTLVAGRMWACQVAELGGGGGSDGGH